MFLFDAETKMKCYFCDETENLKAIRIKNDGFTIGGLIACPKHIKKLNGAILNLNDLLISELN